VASSAARRGKLIEAEGRKYATDDYERDGAGGPWKGIAPTGPGEHRNNAEPEVPDP
jgi:hypothetical protein